MKRLSAGFRFGSGRGATFLELLAVVAVIGGVLSAMGSVFVFGLRSYVGEYSSETGQVEAQRALAEFGYFGSRSLRASISGNGRHVIFYGPSGYTWEFVYEPESGSEGVGSLSIGLPSGDIYTYGGEYLESGPVFSYGGSGVVLSLSVNSSVGPVPLRAVAYPSYVY